MVMMTLSDVPGRVEVRLSDFLKVLKKAEILDEIIAKAQMVDPFNERAPWVMYPTEQVIRDRAPEIFAELTKRCRAEWEDRKAKAEEGEADAY